MEWLTDPDIWIGFVTLLALEVVLGIVPAGGQRAGVSGQRAGIG